MINNHRSARACVWLAGLFASGIAAAAAAQPPPPLVIEPNRDAAYQGIAQGREKLLQSLSPVDDAMHRAPPPGDWLNWRRTYDGYGHSPLKQINRSNVSRLQLAWSWTLPQSVNETTPLVHDGVIFVASGGRVQAFDGSNGDLLWQYTRSAPNASAIAAFALVKSMGIAGNRLFVSTLDRHMLALDVKSGAVLWDVPGAEEAAIKAGSALDGGVIVVKDKVIAGLSSCNRRAGSGACYVTAFDAATGKVAWRFNTIAQPGEPGGDTWNGAPAGERYGGSVWTSGSYDPDLNLLYIGVGNTYDVATLVAPRPGETGLSNHDGLYTESTLALDPETGKLVWHYQHFNGDVWDLDWAFERTLMTLKVDGKDRKVVATAGKAGIFDVLDAKTGQYLFSRDLGFQNLVSSIDKTTGKKTIDPRFAPEVNKTKIVCPHVGGGRNWTATSYNPETRLMYVPVVEACMYYTWLGRTSAETAGGNTDIRWQLAVPPGSDGNFGRVQAIDLATGKTVWKMRHRAPESAALVSTSGGLIFEGSRDRAFRALDDSNGSTLWETRLPAQPSTYPITYAAKGRQYVAVIAGGGSILDGFWGPLTPEVTQPTNGTTLMVYALPEAKP